jgi:hypothetical protein
MPQSITIAPAEPETLNPIIKEDEFVHPETIPSEIYEEGKSNKKKTAKINKSSSSPQIGNITFEGEENFPMSNTSNLTESQTQTNTKTKTKTNIKTDTKTKTKTKTDVSIKVKEFIKEKPKIKIKPIFLDKNSEDEKDNVNNSKEAICWKQGFGYWTIIAPYKKKSDIKFTRDVPNGAKILSGGVNSAYRTIQKLYGSKEAVNLFANMGFMDIKIVNPSTNPGATGSIKFVPDLENKTKHGINLKTNPAKFQQTKE